MFSFNYAGRKITHKDLHNEKIENLTVTVKTKKYEEYDAEEWVLWFENTGNSNTEIISDICDCDTVFPFEIDKSQRKTWGYIPDKSDLCVISMNGMVESDRYWENAAECRSEFAFNYDYLCKMPDGTKSFANRGGRSSDKYMPFFDVTANDAGYIIAIGWTGDWKAEFSEREDGVSVKTGLKETNFYLKPNEKIRTSSVLVMKYTDKEDKYNKFRGLIRDYYSHISCSSAKKEGLMAFEFFGSTTSDVMKQRIEELSNHGIEFEEIWIDAGWYGKCQTNSTTDWDECVGEWVINEETHPKRFQDVVEEAKKANARLMLWIEPERARSDTNVINAHPDWFLSLPGTTNNILNYGNKDAWNYAYNMISGYIDELELSCYRQDFNVPLTSFFEKNDKADRRGITEIKHIMGLYELWDRLLEKYPHLLFDNCSSGGRRFDIETLKRSIPFFRSDYFCNYTADAEVVQVENNAAKYLPYIGCCTKATDEYAMRSSYASSFGFMGWSREYMKLGGGDFEKLKELTCEYKKIRKYFSKDFYNHGAEVYDKAAWTIWQYHDGSDDSGILIAFRRSESPFDSVTLTLKGLSENKNYSYYNFDTKEEKVGNSSLTVNLPEKRTSVVIEYKGK